MIAPRPGPDPTAARTLRELNDLGFLHRERGRFRAGTSELLELTLEPEPGSGIVVDARAIPELRAIAVSPGGGATIGAFTAHAALAAALPALAPAGASLAGARLRLALHDARVTVYGLGRQRVAPLETLTLARHEVPATIAVAPAPRGLGIAERRRTTNDGAASYALGVTAALRITPLARFAGVRLLVELDGRVRRLTGAEALLEGARCDRDLFPEAARAAGAAIETTDARTSALARSVLPLALSVLREAFAEARAAQL